MTRKANGHIWTSVVGAALVAGATALAGMTPGWAADKVIKIGITMPITGADAKSAVMTMHASQMAMQEFNDSGALPGYKVELVVYDNATATAGQYDPAQAATNTKKLVADPDVVANVGPIMSGDGKAMSPILCAGRHGDDHAGLDQSGHHRSEVHAGQFRPNGKAVYFRTVTTDAYQGPNMANYYKDTLKVNSVYILDDSGAYGVGMANAFEAQAKKIGITVLGRDRLEPKEADYTTILTKIKALNPDVDLLRRRRPGRREADQAGLRRHSERDQGRRRRPLRLRHPQRRRLPGGRGLVLHHRLAAHRRPGQGPAVDQEVRGGLRRGPRRLCDHRL